MMVRALICLFLLTLMVRTQDNPSKKSSSASLRQEVIKLKFIKARDLQPLLYGRGSPYARI
ncbi:MAG: hypothetical protein ACUVV5_04955 [Candidatus Aminicenantales bacterium]